MNKNTQYEIKKIYRYNYKKSNSIKNYKHTKYQKNSNNIEYIKNTKIHYVPKLAPRVGNRVVSHNKSKKNIFSINFLKKKILSSARLTPSLMMRRAKQQHIKFLPKLRKITPKRAQQLQQFVSNKKKASQKVRISFSRPWWFV